MYTLSVADPNKSLGGGGGGGGGAAICGLKLSKSPNDVLEGFRGGGGWAPWATLRSATCCYFIKYRVSVVSQYVTTLKRIDISDISTEQNIGENERRNRIEYNEYKGVEQNQVK